MTEPLIAAERENNNEQELLERVLQALTHSEQLWEVVLSQILLLILLYGNISCMSLVSDLQLYIFQNILYRCVGMKVSLCQRFQTFRHPIVFSQRIKQGLRLTNNTNKDASRSSSCRLANYVSPYR